MRTSTVCSFSALWFVSLAVLAAACGSDSNSGTPSAGGAAGAVSAGGANSGTGGSTAASGGATSGSGGAAQGSGGTPATGGSVGAGGASTGGVAGGAGGAEDAGAEPDAAPPATPKGCRINADCAAAPGKPLCDAKKNECIACHTNAQCADTEECVQSACVPLPKCKSSLDCASGADGKTICDKPNGVCVQCTVSADCGDGKVCTNRVCHKSCSSDNECMPLHMLCNQGLSFGGQCTECTTSSECMSGKYCEAGQCVPLTCNPAQQSCTQNLVVQCNDTGSDVIPQQQCTLALLTPACVVNGDNAMCLGFCQDMKKDALETDVDCGGLMCPRCGKGKACTTDNDCTSNKCTSGKCE